MIRPAEITLLVLLFAPGALFALPWDAQQPLRIESDRAELDERSGQAVYRGNVELTQGSLRLNAATLTIVADAAHELTRIEAQGSPVRFRQLQENQQELRGSARAATYTAESGQLILTGDAELTQNGNRFESERIEYSVRTGQVVAGGPERVQVTIQPRSRQDTPQQPATPAGP